MFPFANADPRLAAAIAGLFGLLIGSFLNVVIYRLPANESIVFPGSHCPKCDRPLAAWENLPVLSWLILRGRCSTCRTPISWRYPAIELATAGLWVAVFLAFGPTWQSLFLIALVSLMVVIFWIDFDTQYIFDQTTFPGIALGLLYSGLVTHQFWNSLAAALYAVAVFSLVYGLSWLLLKEEGVGGGDLTLVAMIGAWLGIQGMVLALGLGVVIGALMGMAVVFVGYLRERYWPPVMIALGASAGFGVLCRVLYRAIFPTASPYGLSGWLASAGVAVLSLLLGAAMGYAYTRSTRDRGTDKPRIPFGPALVLGGLISLFWGEALVKWYMVQLGPI